MTRLITKPTTVGSTPEWKYKNRHTSFPPFDFNRSCKEIPNFYISGSDIVTEDQVYLVTAAPLQDTVGDFWTAVLHRKSPLIITTAMPIEKGERFPVSLFL